MRFCLQTSIIFLDFSAFPPQEPATLLRTACSLFSKRILGKSAWSCFPQAGCLKPHVFRIGCSGKGAYAQIWHKCYTMIKIVWNDSNCMKLWTWYEMWQMVRNVANEWKWCKWSSPCGRLPWSVELPSGGERPIDWSWSSAPQRAGNALPTGHPNECLVQYHIL